MFQPMLAMAQVISTLLPLAVLARYPAAGLAALRIIGPAFIVASRILPVQVFIYIYIYVSIYIYMCVCVRVYI